MGLSVFLLGSALLTWKWYEAAEFKRQTDAAKTGALASQYFLSIARAERAWRANDLAGADRLLEECQASEVRGWEWGYIRRLCHSEWRRFSESQDLSRGRVAFSPDGRQLLVASVAVEPTRQEQVVELRTWEVASEREAAAHSQRLGAVNSLLVNGLEDSSVTMVSDGRFVAADCRGHALTPPRKDAAPGIIVWEATSGKELCTLNSASGQILPLSFSPDGQRLATAVGDKLQVWETVTGKHVLSLGDGGAAIGSAAFSLDGRHLAAAADHVVKVWQIQGSQLGASPSPRVMATWKLRRSRDPIRSLIYSPDGERLAVTNGTEVQVWETATGKTVLTFQGHPGRYGGLAYSPDGRQLATAHGNGTITVWDARSGQPAFVLRGHSPSVRGLAYSPDGRLLASVGGDGVIMVWDATTNPEVSESLEGTPASMTSSPDWRWLAGTVRRAGRSEVWIWDTSTGDRLSLLRDHPGVALDMAFTSDGRELVVAFREPQPGGAPSSRVRLFEIPTGREERCLEVSAAAVNSLTFSADGRLLALADGAWVKILDTTTGKESLALGEHAGAVSLMAFSPTGQYLGVVGGRDIALWDVTTRAEPRPLTGHTDAIRCLTFRADGRRLVSASTKEVKVWEVASGREVEEGLTSPGASGPLPASAVALSPDGRRLALPDKESVTLWDVPSGQVAITLACRGGALGQVGFSGNGEGLYAAGKVWDGGERTPERLRGRLAGWRDGAVSWHLNAASAATKKGDGFATRFHLQRLKGMDLGQGRNYVRRGQIYARLGLWEQALADFHQALARPVDRREVAHDYALLLLQTGDLAGYRQLCHSLPDYPVPQPGDSPTADVTRICVLGANPADTLAPLVRRFLEDRTNPSLDRFWLGALLYRAGQFTEALNWLKEENGPAHWLFLAMTHQRLGQGKQARHWLEQAVQHIEQQQEDLLLWQYRLELSLWRREADALVNGTRP
jgi:WD40 repeat protein/tetratricopeptide (TPR) repeat protein